MSKAWVNQLGLDKEVKESLFKLKIQINGKPIERDITLDLGIDYEDLENQMEDMPSVYAFWGMILSEARRQAAIAKKKVKIRRGIVADEVIRQAKEDKMRLNRGDIEDIIEMDEELTRYEFEQIEFDRTAGKLYNIMKALEIRSEALRSLAGFKKQEMRTH